MNILRNFEAAFVVALGVATSASYLAPSPAESTAIATESKMAVVKVPAKRMSAQQKQRSLEDERRLVRQGATVATRL